MFFLSVIERKDLKRRAKGEKVGIAGNGFYTDPNNLLIQLPRVIEAARAKADVVSVMNV